MRRKHVSNDLINGVFPGKGFAAQDLTGPGIKLQGHSKRPILRVGLGGPVFDFLRRRIDCRGRRQVQRLYRGVHAVQ